MPYRSGFLVAIVLIAVAVPQANDGKVLTLEDYHGGAGSSRRRSA
jgi:hypothetical protein